MASSAWNHCMPLSGAAVNFNPPTLVHKTFASERSPASEFGVRASRVRDSRYAFFTMIAIPPNLAPARSPVEWGNSRPADSISISLLLDSAHDGVTLSHHGVGGLIQKKQKKAIQPLHHTMSRTGGLRMADLFTFAMLVLVLATTYG